METRFAEGWDEDSITAVATYVPMALLVGAGATEVAAPTETTEVVFSDDWTTEEPTTIEAPVPTWLLTDGG